MNNEYGSRNSNWKISFFLLHLGAMGEANGLDYLVEAAKILKEKKQEDIKIVIGGDGKSKQD